MTPRDITALMERLGDSPIFNGDVTNRMIGKGKYEDRIDPEQVDKLMHLWEACGNLSTSLQDIFSCGWEKSIDCYYCDNKKQIKDFEGQCSCYERLKDKNAEALAEYLLSLFPAV